MTTPEPPLTLRDIHLPDPLSWWPPAPGWWVVTGLLVITLGLAGSYWRWRRSSRTRALALRALAEMVTAHARHRNDARLARALSALLRRATLAQLPPRTASGTRTAPRHEVAGLTGEAWLQFLERSMPDRPFTQGPGRILLVAPFQKSGGEASSQEMAALLALCRRYLRSLGTKAPWLTWGAEPPRF